MTSNAFRQDIVRPTLRAGDMVPDFLQWSSEGPIRLHDWLGDRWGLVLTAPCSAASAPFDRQRVQAIGSELARRGVMAVVLRPQGRATGAPHARPDALVTPGLEHAPVIVNPEPGVAAAFGLCGAGDAGGEGRPAMQWAVLVDPGKVVRAVIACPAAVGSPLAEIEQVLAALQGEGPNAWPWRGGAIGPRSGAGPRNPACDAVQPSSLPVH